MLEKMDVFFENRLAGYDEHMLANIEGAIEFYKFTAAQLPMGTGSKVLESLHHFTEKQKESCWISMGIVVNIMIACVSLVFALMSKLQGVYKFYFREKLKPFRIYYFAYSFTG